LEQAAAEKLEQAAAEASEQAGVEELEQPGVEPGTDAAVPALGDEEALCENEAGPSNGQEGPAGDAQDQPPAPLDADAREGTQGEVPG